MSNTRDIERKLNVMSESWWTTGEGVNRTPLLPTRRHGRDSLIFIQFEMPYTQPRGSRPSAWGIVDYRSGRLHAYSALRALDPLHDLRTVKLTSAGGTSMRDLRKALAVEYPHWVDKFFGEAETQAQDRQRVIEALLSAVPDGLVDWAFTYCHDFWSWLSDEAAP